MNELVTTAGWQEEEAASKVSVSFRLQKYIDPGAPDLKGVYDRYRL